VSWVYGMFSDEYEGKKFYNGRDDIIKQNCGYTNIYKRIIPNTEL